jgi:hypothetical protein
MFHISESHRQKVINSFIKECYYFSKEQEDSPLKLPSLNDRKRYTAILDDPHNGEEVKITAIVDGTEQELEKSVDYSISLDTWSGKKKHYTVQKIVFIK